MGKLTDDEQKLLDELTARANAPDEDDEFEIEVYDTQKGKGARIPFRHGKNWLWDTFGIGSAPEQSSSDGDGAGNDDGAGDGDKQPRTFFGRK